MSRTITTLTLFLLYQIIVAQPSAKVSSLSIPEDLTYATTDISAYIKEHVSTDTARIRAIFSWVAKNINYDIVRFKTKNFAEQSLDDVLRTRLAVCKGYAELFNELCKQCNIKSVVVPGYTRQNGVVAIIAHAWVAAELDNRWWLFDPTWAAGYVTGNKFTKGYSTKYYNLSPEVMILDHMPFDPMFQFLEHPLNNKDFIEGRTAAAAGKTFFNYADTLKKFNPLTKEEKVKNELRRVQHNGIENSVIQDYVVMLGKQEENFSSKNTFEQAMLFYNRSIALFNNYIDHKNKQFSAVEANDIKVIIDSVLYNVNASYKILGSTVANNEANRQSVSKVYKELERFQNVVSQEKDFVTTYINTDIASRKKLFYKKPG